MIFTRADFVKVHQITVKQFWVTQFRTARPLCIVNVALIFAHSVAGGGAALPTSVTSNADKVWVVYLQA